MAKSLLRTDKDIAEIYYRHVNTVYRVCFAYMKNIADTEDAVQSAFVKLVKYRGIFENSEHEKAWLIRIASNVCKDNLRHWWRRRESFEDNKEMQYESDFEIDEMFGVVMNLPHKYKTVIYLYYYEGYTSVDIARILGKPQSTVRNYLHEARKILRNTIGGDFDEE